MARTTASPDTGTPREEQRPAPLDGSGPATPVIALRGVTATLGTRPVLRGVDLSVGAGEAVALLGANGSGKSTTIRAVIGQTPISGGELRLFGAPLTGPGRFRDWRRVGYVPQRSTAASGVPATVREVVSSGRLGRRGLRPLGRADKRAVRHALELVDMAGRERDPVHALSGGQHQRVLIARALAGEPELLIMDEPLTGIDLASQRVLADALRERRAEGVSLLFVLHELGPLAPLIDRSVVLRDGLVERVEHPEQLHDLACHPHEAAPDDGALAATGLRVGEVGFPRRGVDA
ncbi:ATP-binding cassette domain-containing protein [Streptomyces sp. AJS327]|uniref:metal ABC transporter ATP-binding protein n=1 Tax=Streptomyces sp. AJS327 TaxID=2545265 RepID=UPI0015DFE9E0|nr:ATP-binding cassette domain-containing protein [Streptomyces sp. AJS327]MBA0049914.1 ATP-binding cassette domain-containing protein [Streptomyces sp. AJS327]